MIFQEVTPAKQMALTGFSCTTASNVITIPTETDLVEFCLCDFVCEVVEYAFAYPIDDTNSYKNDYKSFLLNLKDDTSTFSITLITPKDGEIPLNDNSLGELFDKGFNEKQPLQVGYRLDWVTVLPLYGEGQYSFKIEQTDFGNTVSVETHKFYLKTWDEIRANNTVKIEFTQKGKILNGEDYTGVSWDNMLRLESKFGNVSPQYEINRLQDSNYTDLDVQTMKYNNYNLETLPLPSSIGNMLTDNLALTDEIYISVNDVFNYEQYRRLQVVFEGSIELSNDYARNNMKVFNVTFKDKISKLKRNFN